MVVCVEYDRSDRVYAYEEQVIGHAVAPGANFSIGGQTPCPSLAGAAALGQLLQYALDKTFQVNYELLY